MVESVAKLALSTETSLIVPSDAKSGVRVIAGPQHKWVYLPDDQTHQRRRCEVCFHDDWQLLKERRRRPRIDSLEAGPRSRKSFELPCVVGIPGLVELNELKGRLLTSEIDLEPCLFGTPGHWLVGLRDPHAFIVAMYPMLDVHEKRPERCWSILCRWLEAIKWNLAHDPGFGDLRRTARRQSGWE
jgi:hypothetical protein